MKKHFFLFLWLSLLGACQNPQRELNVNAGSYTYLVGRDLQNRKIFYKEHQGQAIVEGDIVLGTVAQVEERRQLIENSSIRTAIKVRWSTAFWPQARVPYTIDTNLSGEDRIQNAIDHIESNTSVRFFPREREADYVTFREIPNGCSSNVGKSGGQQFINMGSQCSAGNVVHEIGHAIGLWHEQSRSDRKEHIIILWDNISPDERFNFDQHVSDGTDVGDYDYDSIMHYGAFAFSKNGNATITKLDGSTSGLGNRRNLSDADISAIQSIYTRLTTR